MILHNTPQQRPVQPETRYDTLVVSQDRQLFTQFSAFLKEFEPDRIPFLADDLTTFSSNEKNLSQCDVMICDLRTPSPSVELGAYAVDCVPAETLAIGLTSDHADSQETFCRQQNLRFSGIIDNRKGWLANWNQITAIKQAWHNPLMVSRIEEVPVSDVLQMIASGRWSVVVHVTGYGMSTLPILPNKACKGCISFYQGVPQTAWSWNSAGIQAMFDLLSLKKGILQVVKNLCPPTVRNVYLQTDEVLLSHAVALDESVMTSLGIQPPAPTPSPVAASPEPKTAIAATWWTTNRQHLVTALNRASERSLPFRTMKREELADILRKRQDAAVMVVYGSVDTLDAFFSRCARGFSREKLSGEELFPVIRLGRSGEPCLYVAGSAPSVDGAFPKPTPALILQPRDFDPATCDRLLERSHSMVFTSGSPSFLTEQAQSPSSSPVVTLPAYDRSWEGISTLLQSVCTSLAGRD